MPSSRPFGKQGKGVPNADITLPRARRHLSPLEPRRESLSAGRRSAHLLHAGFHHLDSCQRMASFFYSKMGIVETAYMFLTWRKSLRRKERSLGGSHQAEEILKTLGQFGGQLIGWRLRWLRSCRFLFLPSPSPSIRCFPPFPFTTSSSTLVTWGA